MERAIRASTVRRRPRQQARPLSVPRMPLRRFLAPIVVFGAVLGVVARLLVASTMPSDPLTEADPRSFTAESIPLAKPELSQPAGPPADPRAVAEQRMREAVFAPFRGLTGRFGIAVKDFGSGVTIALNENAAFPAASLYKLPVMYEVFKLRESGLLTFSEELTIGPEDAAYDLGSLNWPIGTRITLGTALERMITISDNSSAFMLTRRVGAWRVNEDAASLGLQQTYIRADDLSTSPLDMLRLLELIASGQAIDESSSAEMVHLLARQGVRNRIPALLPPEATVANKTGNWEDAAHDVGLIYAPRATLGIAFLSEGVTDIDGVHLAMARAALNLYELADEAVLEAPARPLLPPMVRSSYAVEAKLPPPAVVTRAPVVATSPSRDVRVALNPTATLAPVINPLQATSRATEPIAPPPTPNERSEQVAPPPPTASTEAGPRAGRSNSRSGSTSTPAPSATAQPTSPPAQPTATPKKR
jgi:beta-lactamase class A